MSDRVMADEVYGAGVPTRAVLVLVALVGVVAVALGFRQIGGLDDAHPCADPVAERLDPASSQHLLPGADGEYPSSAPTSGAHRSGNHPTGVLSQPIPRPVQVALLEEGGVIVQYTDAVSASARRDIKAFVRANEGVTSAPALASPEADIVVTAWQYKMRCGDFDADAFADFVKAHLDKTAAH